MSKFIKLTIIRDDNVLIPKLISIDEISSFSVEEDGVWINYKGKRNEDGGLWGDRIKETPKTISDALAKETHILIL